MNFTSEPYEPDTSANWLICNACGHQFPSADRASVRTCHICDDPRQFVPASGQTFTTMKELRETHHNEFTPYTRDARITFISTSPSFAIGQCATLIKTPKGNILWDCIALLDDETIRQIKDAGGLRLIAISHPHFYTSHVQWARAFGCPVYLASADKMWTTLRSPHQQFVSDIDTDLFDTGAKLIKLGGHFPGSFTLLFDGHLFHADTLMTSPAGVGKYDVDATGEPRKTPPGLTSFSFLWSIPNRIPLSADEMARMWDILRHYEFHTTHSSFVNMSIESPGVKASVLESMKIQARFMGHPNHALLSLTI